MAEPVGWVVAVRTEEGRLVLDTAGMWPSAEEAEQDRADGQAYSDEHGYGDRYLVAAVVPVEESE